MSFSCPVHTLTYLSAFSPSVCFFLNRRKVVNKCFIHISLKIHLISEQTGCHRNFCYQNQRNLRKTLNNILVLIICSYMYDVYEHSHSLCIHDVRSSFKALDTPFRLLRFWTVDFGYRSAWVDDDEIFKYSMPKHTHTHASKTTRNFVTTSKLKYLFVMRIVLSIHHLSNFCG